MTVGSEGSSLLSWIAHECLSSVSGTLGPSRAAAGAPGFIVVWRIMGTRKVKRKKAERISDRSMRSIIRDAKAGYRNSQYDLGLGYSLVKELGRTQKRVCRGLSRQL